MNANEIKNAVNQITKTVKKDVYAGIRKAEQLFEGWERKDVMCNPSGYPTERFAIFQDGRRSVIINYCENRPHEVVITNSRESFHNYIDYHRVDCCGRIAALETK
jgi:hypothetical protein